MALEAALARHRVLSIAALVVLTVLAWAWLIAGAGTEMAPLASLAPLAAPGAAMPGMAMDTAMPEAWTPGHFALVFIMWWTMMVAMMLPSAAPTVLLYARASAHGAPPSVPATGCFLAGYLAVWGLFSLFAALLQQGLERMAMLAPAVMTSQSDHLSAAILICAGVYQLSPLKNACLRHCRSPAQFLARHYRPGEAGALRMGMIHGSWCVGCCWLLMALLLVGGVMNLAWIALLTLMVASEKLLPHGRLVAVATGLGCLAWGLGLLLG